MGLFDFFSPKSSSSSTSNSTTYTETISDAFNTTLNEVRNWQNVGNVSAVLGTNAGKAESNAQSTIADTLNGKYDEKKPINLGLWIGLAVVAGILILTWKYFGK